MATDAVLKHGPQDGAKICIHVEGPMPELVYVAVKWLGDNYAAFARKPSSRKPATYRYHGEVNGLPLYTFTGYHK